MLTYYFARRTIAFAGLAILEETGLPYMPRRLDFQAGEQRSEPYISLNPKGRVPLLVTEFGSISETAAILTYLAAKAPGKNLALGANDFTFAQVQSILSYLASTVHVNHAHGPRGSRWSDDPAAQASMKAKVPETMAASYQHIENDLFIGPYVFGETFTIADAHLFAISRWLEGDGVNINTFPKIARHFIRVSERASVQRALAVEDR